MSLFCLCAIGSHAQVQIGTGTSDQGLPIYPNYGYTYSQSIYLASEINATGNITSIQWYYSGVNTMPNSQNLVVYLGHTTKTEFASDEDWEDIADLTQVYTGGIVVASGSGWATITFNTPFAYNGTDNLVVAVEDNMAGYDNYNDRFYSSSVSGERSLVAYSDTINIDPSNPNEEGNGDDTFVSRYTLTYVPNVILGGIQQTCPVPNQLTAANVTTTSATFNWHPVGSETAWEVLVLEDGSDAPTPTTSGIAVTGTPTYSISTLSTASTYQFYVRASCGDGFSPWVPMTLVTLCDSIGDFEEGFSSTPEGGIPDCWYKIVDSSSEYAGIEVYTDGFDETENNVVELYNSDDANAKLLLVTPKLTDLPLGTHRLKFRGRSYGGSVIVGTMTERGDMSTFTPVQTVDLADEFTQYYVNIPATTNGFIAFKHQSDDSYVSVILDDIIWEPIPASAPECITDMSVSVDGDCGNFATGFEWSAVDLAEGYHFSVGTSPGVYNVVNNASIGDVASYSFSGNYNTTYYYKIVPFNAFSDAVGCAEGTFTTTANGCYCVSEPESVDNDGVTSVQLGTEEFDTSGGLTYYNNSDNVVTLGQGLHTNVKLAFATSYTYDTHIWIDFNDNYTYEESEKVYTGESVDEDETVLNASFNMPVNAAVGTHSMRIAAADSGEETPDPCYNGTYGVTLDFAVNIVVPTCTPPTVTSSTIVPDCANNQYFIDVNVATLGDGTPTITDDTTTYPVTAAGIVHTGPFEVASLVSLTFLHGSDTICDFPIGDFTYVCPPANDDCSGAVAMTVNTDYECNTVSEGTVYGATASNVENAGVGTPNDDVWYSFVATQTSHRVSIINIEGSNTDMVHQVLKGNCDVLAGVDINDGNTTDLTSLEIGATYYVRVFTYSSDTGADTTFNVCVGTDPDLGTTRFNNSGFTYYPNPVKNVLNLSYTQNISDVAVFNLIGQQVIAKNVNSNSGQIDMSGLAAGTYMVKVTADNQVKTIKVIKE